MKKILSITLLLFITLSTSAQTQGSHPEEKKSETSFISVKKRTKGEARKKRSRLVKETISQKPVVTPRATVQDPENSLAVTMLPKFYKKRDKAVLDIGLVYYGDHYSMDDLSRVQNLFEERFFKATGELLKINTVAKAVVPFKTKIEAHPEYSQPYITEIDRLQRLWYYDNVGMGVAYEVYQIFKKENHGIDLEQLDALVVVTGAQFDGLGFASGRVAVTENPMEIAWGLEDGGHVEFISDAKVVDELIHEVGHTLYLGHSSNQCQKPGLTYLEREACCKTSPGKDDVMSYCRSRDKVNETFFYGFNECNRKIISEKVIPSLLSGGEWVIPNRDVCL